MDIKQVNSWIQTKWTFDQKQLTDYEEFMTDSLQKEARISYARAINRLGRNCVAWMKRELRKADDKVARDLLGAGIVSVPKTAKRILHLGDPLRAVIGAGSNRKRHPNLGNVVGQRFLTTVSNEQNRRLLVVAQRNRDSEHVSSDDALSPKRIRYVTASGRVSWSEKTYVSHQDFEGYRNTSLPITIIHPVVLKEQHNRRFNEMINAYMARHFDKVMTQEFNKAVDRDIKKRSR